MKETKYALIYKDIIVNRFDCNNYEEANLLARASHGNEAFAVETTRYKTSIGDSYLNGRFYNLSEEGELVEAEYIPTEEDRIRELEEKLELALTGQIKAVEEKTILEDKVVQLQQLMSEIYEKTEV